MISLCSYRFSTAWETIAAADWIGTAGLAVTIFATIWSVFGQSRLRSATIAALAGLIGASALAAERGVDHCRLETIKNNVRAMAATRYFWTFDDFVMPIQKLHPNWVISPILQGSLSYLSQPEINYLRLCSYEFYDGNPPEKHVTNTYCVSCRLPTC